MATSGQAYKERYPSVLSRFLKHDGIARYGEERERERRMLNFSC